MARQPPPCHASPTHLPHTTGNGTAYIKNERPPQYAAWKEVDEITAGSFYPEGDSMNIQK
jgi:hypothetical protein